MKVAKELPLGVVKVVGLWFFLTFGYLEFEKKNYKDKPLITSPASL